MLKNKVKRSANKENSKDKNKNKKPYQPQRYYSIEEKFDEAIQEPFLQVIRYFRDGAGLLWGSPMAIMDEMTQEEMARFEARRGQLIAFILTENLYLS